MDPIRRMTELEPAKKAFSLFEEFKQFAFKGNVIDLAIGVVIGAAFGKIIDSLVKNVIMPVVGLLLPSDKGYEHWKLVVGDKEVPYGLFISDLLNFLIVALRAISLHRQIPRLDHEKQKGGGRTSAAADQGPGVVDGDPRPLGQAISLTGRVPAMRWSHLG